MLYGVRHDELILIVAADDLLEFETFAHNCGTIVETNVEISRADILDMLGDDRFSGLTIAPVKVESTNEGAIASLSDAIGLSLVDKAHAINQQADMLYRAKLEAQIDEPVDRRTLAEIYGLDDDDPWDNRTDEEKAQGRKEDADMKAKRAAGGVTGESFGGTMGDKVSVHGTTVKMDSDGNVTGVDVRATKNSMQAYELHVDHAGFSFDKLFDDLRIPENRITAVDDNTVIIMLHSFQINQISSVLDRESLVYSFTRQIAEDEQDDELLSDRADLKILFSVQVNHGTIHEMSLVLAQADFDIDKVVTMRNVDDGCWFVFAQKADAETLRVIFEQAGHHANIVAVNRRGRALIGTGTGAVVIDTNEAIIVEPRPWNSRADDYERATGDEREAIDKGIKTSEFIFTVDDSDLHRTVIYITPESYFIENKVMWPGTVPLSDMVPQNLVTLIEGTNRWACRSLDSITMMTNLNQWGFIDSLKLRMYINDLISEASAA